MKTKTVNGFKGRKRTLRMALSLLLSLALLVTMAPVAPGMSLSANATGSLTIEKPILVVTGSGVLGGDTYSEENVGYEKSYTLEELKALETVTQLYSTINTNPTKSIYLGKGITIETLLAESNLTESDYQDMIIDVVSGDTRVVCFDPEHTGHSLSLIHICGMGF